MSEHLLVFPDRAVADEVAAELAQEGFTQVRVVAQPRSGGGRGPRDAGTPPGAGGPTAWGVVVREDNVVDESRPVAKGLRERFTALVEERGGWYDAGPTPR